jgi:hypothetical protein
MLEVASSSHCRQRPEDMNPDHSLNADRGSFATQGELT